MTTTRVLIVGDGAVGSEAERLLSMHAGVDVTVIGRGGHDGLADSDVVVCAVPRGADVGLITHAVKHDVAVVSAGDDTSGHRAAIDAVSALGAHNPRVVLGAGVAPGLSDVLARHAATLFDTVEDIRVARAGVAGHASVQTLRAAIRDDATEWRDGTWTRVRRAGPELVWFPGPIGARECEPADLGVVLLQRAFPAANIGVRCAPPPSPLARLKRDPLERDEWAAIRVEVWGMRDGEHSPVVYGAIAPCARAAGAVLTTTALALAGRGPGLVADTRGVGGLAQFVDPVPFLAELQRCGVTAATFEGVAAPEK